MASRDEKKVKNKEEEAKDRLSDLPDSLLLNILSFLPEIKCAVRTCVLSKRWKCLWTSLPDLIFWGCWDIPLLKKIARKVLSSLYNLPVRKLCFSYPGLDKSLVTRVINYPISHNVQHFDIRLGSSSFRILLPLFNRCRSLKTLELHSLRDVHLLEDISLPTLTTLHISNSSFYPFESNHSVYFDPFVGLVNLKSLRIENCQIHDIGVFKISGPQLHSLTICDHFFSIDCKVEIFAPKLHLFKLFVAYPIEFCNLDFPLLETADIDVIRQHLKQKSHLDLINMFRGLYHARSLYLSSRTIEFLMKFPSQLEDQVSPFARLKTLNVRSRCNPLSIPGTLMNYFVRGSSFGRNISIKIKEDEWQKP